MSHGGEEACRVKMQKMMPSRDRSGGPEEELEMDGQPGGRWTRHPGADGETG